MEGSGRKVRWMSKLKEFWSDLVLIVGMIVGMFFIFIVGNDLVLIVGTDMDTILYHRSDLLL